MLEPAFPNAYVKQMSRAFVKETEAVEALPEKLVSEHRNLVTPEGLAMIEGEVARLQGELAEAQQADDRSLTQRLSRDLRYWNSRLATAEVQPLPSGISVLSFGGTVTIERDDKRVQTFRIVGEDEADPAKGSISYTSPLAQALLGKSAGDVVKAAGREAEIVEIK